MALTRKDIADLRLELIRGYSSDRDAAFCRTFRPVIGELLARADAFEKMRSAVLLLHEPDTKNIPAGLRRLRQQLQDVIAEFDDLAMVAERLRQQG